MNPKVSVIVPVYNVEKYLSKCIESIINQTLKDIEIILVNDGSTDNSGKIIDRYAVKDKRIKVIHKKNEGQGSARNAGIDIATGEYVGFVDSDDWIDSDMYENLYIKAKEEALDVAVCGRKVWSENNVITYKINMKNEILNDLQNDLPDYIVNYLLYTYTVSTCNKIYKSKMLKNNNIRFDNVKNVGSEDALFNIYVSLNINKIASVSDTYYNGIERNGSTTRKYMFGCMKRIANLLESIYGYCKKINKSELADSICPILLIFFQQWNYNFLKSYKKEDLFNSMVIEQREAEKNKYFKRAEKSFIVNRNAQVYINKMGYSTKGKLFIKLYMILSLLGLYRTAIKIRLIL